MHLERQDNKQNVYGQKAEWMDTGWLLQELLHWTNIQYSQGCEINQILFLVHGQVNGQNPLVQARFTYQKIKFVIS